MEKKIQVSTTAKPRDEYTSQFKLNTEVKKEWIPKKPTIDEKLKIENIISLNIDDYAPVYKSYTSNDTFQAGNKGCVVFVLVVGGSGYGTKSKRWSNFYADGWSNPVGGWQIDDNTDHKTQIYNKSQQRKDFVHRADGFVAEPSSFGKYLSANAGISIADTTTKFTRYRTWTIKGWASGWDWGSGQIRNRSETQDIKLSSGQFDGDLLGTSGEVKFGIFTLKPNEVVNISVGSGAVNGHVDLVYFELRNGNDEVITKPSKPNDVTVGITLPKPNIPQKPTQNIIPLDLIIKPNTLELQEGSKKQIEIITNATSFTSQINNTIASFDEATKEVTAKAKGDTMLIIDAVRDKETIRRAINIKVIEKVIIKPNLPQQTTQIPKSINFTSLLPNLQTMNTEQLAYMYVIGFVWNEIFKAAQNDNSMTVLHTNISETKKKELQDLYDTQRINYIQKKALIGYASSGYAALANHISVYPFMQNKDETHLQLLESLIVEKESIEQGTRFDYAFSDNVKNMSNEDFTDNLEVWIKEAKGIIVRTKGDDPLQQTQN